LQRPAESDDPASAKEDEVHVIAIHSISEPQRFWESVRQTDIPEGMALHSVMPNADGSRAVCVWEADSSGAVTELVEGTVGELSSNEYFEVDPANAQGLPA
jgi:hypothetical protein